MNTSRPGLHQDSMEPQADNDTEKRLWEPQMPSPPGSVVAICQSLENLRDWRMTNVPSYERGQENLLVAIEKDIAEASASRLPYAEDWKSNR